MKSDKSLKRSHVSENITLSFFLAKSNLRHATEALPNMKEVYFIYIQSHISFDELYLNHHVRPSSSIYLPQPQSVQFTKSIKKITKKKEDAEPQGHMLSKKTQRVIEKEKERQL